MSHGRAINFVLPSDKCLTRRRLRVLSVPPRAVRSRGAVYPMHPNAILHDVRQLYKVSDPLDSCGTTAPRLRSTHHPLGKRS